MALIRGGDGIVKPWVQRFADALEMNTDADSFGTYNGHDPDISLAMDVFVPVGSRVLGDSITSFALQDDNWTRYGIWYMIYRQRIYNPEIGSYWRDMARRGDPNNFDYTANHYDHVHFSFYASVKSQEPAPTPIIKGDMMSLVCRYIWGPDALHQTDWVFDGPSRIFATGMTAEVLNACDKNKVVELGHVEDQTHNWFQNVASSWK